MKRNYVFGPVMSRRLGVSLGVDLVPPKTCPLDCIYCEARATTDLTLVRREYVPVDEVIAELDAAMKNAPMPDYVTFSGAGEPTLNSRIGDVVAFVKTSYPRAKLCLLTNGLLLGDAALRRDLADVDLVIPSLDASCEEEYRKINRPIAGSTLAQLVTDLAGFARGFTRRLVLELFIVPGINDSPASIARFAEHIRRIRPHAVQLNTLDRPGVVPGIAVAPPETLAAFAAALSPVCPVETIRPLAVGKRHSISTSLEESLLDIIRHRRLTPTGLALAAGIPDPELAPMLERLKQRNWLTVGPDGCFTVVEQP
ncbi:MAG: radical SAM protein [Lentisphaeria bacterium]|nr:radical SAM protein [Lentisphaeria bacterium]